jgi:holin-like protein
VRFDRAVPAPDRLLPGLLDVLACWAVGEVVSAGLDLPVPGAVVGLVLLLVLLRVQPEPRAEPVADGLLRLLPLLFVPAGVGVVAHLDVLRDAVLPVVLGLAVPLLLGLAVTGVVVDRLLRRRA